MGRRLGRHRPLRATWEVGSAMVTEWQRDRVTGLAAEVAFFAVLSVFPGLLALTAGLGSLEALFGPEVAADTERIVLDAIGSAVGEDSATVEEVASVFAEPQVGLLTAGLVLALWGLSRGFAAIIRALDVAYGIAEGRNWLRLRLLAVAMSLGSVVVAVVLLGTLVLGPLMGSGQDIADAIGLGDAFARAWTMFRWPVALGVLMGWAALVYHLAPNRRTRWRDDLPGAVLAGLAWVGISFGFRVYLSVSGEGNQVFGALGGALTLLFWLYLLAIGLLVGGELNAVLTRRRTGTIKLDPDAVDHLELAVPDPDHPGPAPTGGGGGAPLPEPKVPRSDRPHGPPTVRSPAAGPHPEPSVPDPDQRRGPPTGRGVGAHAEWAGGDAVRHLGYRPVMSPQDAQSGGEERRQHRRHPIHLTVGCRRAGGRTHDEQVTTVDLSEGGAGIIASDRFGIGDVIDLRLEVDGTPVDVRGLIVGSRPAPQPGKVVHNVAFRSLDDVGAAPLRRLLATQGA